MTDLSDIDIRTDIAKRISEEIDIYAEITYNDGHRNHMGASLIGDDCQRKTWSTYRWLKKPNFTGRMQRLFQRGHLEEARFQDYLIALGFIKEPANFDEQVRISDVSGHFGGSVDDQWFFPKTWGISEKIIAEYKTKGTGAGFNKLKEKGVILTNATHWSQMCVYGYKLDIKYGLYLAVNKNDDDIHVELLELDHDLAKDMIRKAVILIGSQSAPQRISKTQTDFRCKNCMFVGICHNDEKPERNCRSCLHASPITDAKWSCAKYGAPIPIATIKTGCPTWVSIV